MASGNMDVCELCSVKSEPPVTVTRSVKRGIWSYLYHRSVRETLIPSTSTGQEDSGGGDNGATRLPKLTFKLSVEGLTGSYQNVVLCEDCSVELDKLSQLDQQLESVKKVIETQVARINEIQIEKGDGKRISGWIGSELDMAMGGCVVGTGNISMALKFLDNLCKGMAPSFVTASSPSPSGRLVEPVAPELTPITPGADAFMNVGRALDATPAAVTNKICKDESIVESGSQDSSQDPTGNTSIFKNDSAIMENNGDDDSSSQGTPHRFGQVDDSSTTSILPGDQSLGDETDEEHIGTHQQKDSTSTLPSSGNFPMELQLFPNLDLIKMEVETEPVILKQELHFTPGGSGPASLVSEDVDETSSTSYTCEVHPLPTDPLATGGQFQRLYDAVDPDLSSSLTNSAISSRKRTSQTRGSGHKKKWTKKECRICEKLIHEKHFSRHMRVHTGARPFQCDVCFKTFPRRDVRDHHKGGKRCIPPSYQ